MGTPTSADKERIEHQFDTLIKKAIKGISRNYKSKQAKQTANEVTFSALFDDFVDTLETYDKYPSDYYNFKIYGFDISIKDELLGEAVTMLSEQNRIIILMSYFLDMSDYQIADFLHLVRTTVTYRRNRALKNLRKIMEEMTDGKKS